jgi:hypothetical protein
MTGTTEETMALETVGAKMPTDQIAVKQDITLKELAQTFVASGFWKDTTTAAQAVVKIMAGHELGVPPIASMTSVHVFDGKVELGAKLLSSLIKRAPQYRFKQVRISDAECVLEFYERDRDDGAWSAWESMGESTFTYDEAKQANLTNKHNWKAWRQDMLFARALSRGFRRFCADLSMGGTVYVEGEISDAVPTVAQQSSTQRRTSTASLNERLQVEQVETQVDTSKAVPERSERRNSSLESTPEHESSVETDEQSAQNVTKRAETTADAVLGAQTADNAPADSDAAGATTERLSDTDLLTDVRTLEKALGWAANSVRAREERTTRLGVSKLLEAPAHLVEAYCDHLRDLVAIGGGSAEKNSSVGESENNAGGDADQDDLNF